MLKPNIFPFIRKCFIFIIGIIAFASESVVTMATVTATRGHDAELYCKLTHHKNVIQVTWKKITSNSTENVATYSRLGAIIAPSFQEHVRFLEARLHKSSLLIKGVRRDEEACYSCMFYSYPKGAMSSTACLKAYELSEPVTEVRETISRDNGILQALNCSFGHRRASHVPKADNGVPAESSVRHSSEIYVPVIKASVMNGHDLTCVARPPPVAKRKEVPTVKGEPRVMFLSNRNGRLSPTLSFVIFVTGLSMYNVINLI